ncbi:uncharacterized protein M6B38_324790 [Iris pallida]|uniref:Uncharacterized protein n=1 Tax=Iris pallida TaxID=29817 RepID=A0AAX6H7I0_IRIPA|nr:Uncharacterized protein M6B38_237655 [Iris pallida]KAJ6836969.1 uncharacterized protein M6B38_324790 [Iris pallida]
MEFLRLWGQCWSLLISCRGMTLCLWCCSINKPGLITLKERLLLKSLVCSSWSLCIILYYGSSIVLGTLVQPVVGGSTLQALLLKSSAVILCMLGLPAVRTS